MLKKNHLRTVKVQEVIVSRFTISVMITIICLVLLLSGSDSVAQTKIRYINSQRILSEYPAAQEIQKKLDEIRTGYEKE